MVKERYLCTVEYIAQLNNIKYKRLIQKRGERFGKYVVYIYTKSYDKVTVWNALFPVFFIFVWRVIKIIYIFYLKYIYMTK